MVIRDSMTLFEVDRVFWKRQDLLGVSPEYENIKGFVGVQIALCMYTKYFACIQICTKCFVMIQNSIHIF